MSQWEIESVPDGAALYMRVHKNWLEGNGLKLGVFRNRDDGGMSVDWEKYSTAQDTRKRARDPAANYVIVLIAGEVRNVPEQKVVHEPDVETNNRAHTNIFGVKDEEARVKFGRLWKWAIEPSPAGST